MTDTELKYELDQALETLRTSARRSARKGDRLKQWIRSVDPNAIPAASYVTEKKQVYNRVGEQFDRGATDVIFLAETLDIADLLVLEVRRKVYSALATVAIFTRDAAGYHLSRLLARDVPDKVGSFLTRTYEAASQLLTAETTTSLIGQRFTPEGNTIYSALNVDWKPALEAPPSADGTLLGVDDAYRHALNALRNKNVILLGAPGVGKSKLAEYICHSLRVEFRPVTATAEWTTFDTIGGYFPKPGGELEFKAGIITESIEQRLWVIVDEINRADIDKAFGELFSVLSDQPVTLPYSRTKGDKQVPVVLGARRDDDAEYGIPLDPDWRIIGTMNTADKSSLFRMSAAFMRRFAFIEVPVPEPPDYALLIDDQFQIAEERTPSLSRLNEHLKAAFADNDENSLRGAGLEIGPAIVIDFVKFAIEARSDLERDFIGTVLAAYSMFVLPQLEGRDEYYPLIAERLPSLLDLNELPAAFDKDVRGWLGAS